MIFDSRYNSDLITGSSKKCHSLILDSETQQSPLFENDEQIPFISKNFYVILDNVGWLEINKLEINGYIKIVGSNEMRY